MSEVTSNFPQLRFPDFDDKWEEKRLSDIAEKSNVKNRDNEVSSVFTNSATKGVVNQRDFFDKDIVNQNNLDGYYIINHDNFVYNPRISFSAPVGPLNRNHLGTGVMSPLYTILKINNVSLDFIERYFKTTKWHRYMNNIANIGARHDRMNIISSDFMKMPIPLPKDEEQQKIAASLAAVDNKIEQLSKKQELLGEYKKGLMQQIFSQEIRFKADDGSDFPDWEEKKLGNISNVSKLAGYEFTKYIKYQDTGSIIALRGLNIKKNKLDLSVVKFIDNSDFSRLNRSKLFIDDLMFTYIGTIGEVALIDEDDKYYLAPNVSRIRFNNEVCLPRFAIQYFNREVFKQGEIKKYVSSSSQPALTMGNVRLFILNLPTKPEQQKIANFLSSIDSKIEQVGEQLDKSKQFKKALLQKMFV